MAPESDDQGSGGRARSPARGLGRASAPGRPKGGPGAKGVKVATARYLENAALHYLERFASTSENLRRVLMRKVRRSAEAHGTDEREGAQTVESLIERFRQSKLIDDRAFAESRAKKLHDRGGSSRAIRARLGAYGVDEGDIDRALTSLEGGEQSADLEAAWAYARRRKLGPYRADDERRERRERDMGAMARAGFGYSVACRVIDAPEPLDR